MRQRLDIIGLEFSSIVDQKRKSAECGGSRHKAANRLMIGKVGKDDVGLASCFQDSGSKPFRVLA
jgi:hypothetical protein